MSFGVGDVELEGFRQRRNRVADLLLRELAVAERVPAPRRARMIPSRTRRAAARPPCTSPDGYRLRGRPSGTARPRQSSWRPRVRVTNALPQQAARPLLSQTDRRDSVRRPFGKRPVRPRASPCFSRTIARYRCGSPDSGTSLMACWNLDAASGRSPLSNAARPSATSRFAFWVRSSAATRARGPCGALSRLLPFFLHEPAPGRAGNARRRVSARAAPPR